MNLYYDLHIHSCLSPCGDEDMTPANIAGMAAVKGLDLIALTDHNTAKNCPALLRAAEEYGVLALPGMEVTTAEEVHAVCLFSELSAALEFDAFLYEKLLPIANREEIFGRQLIYDKNDAIVGKVEKLLISAVSVSFDELWDLALSYGGVMFPAHIDKNANSLLSNLGFIPPDSKFQTAELADMKRYHGLRAANPYLAGCKIITSSDAHYLPDINEPVHTIDVKEKNAASVIAALREGQSTKLG